jgi:hypothetical protein
MMRSVKREKGNYNKVTGKRKGMKDDKERFMMTVVIIIIIIIIII